MVRAALLTSASVAWVAALFAPAFADCLEDVEGFDLAALQNGTAISGGDPNATPTARGRATYSTMVQQYLLEAETAAKAGNEPQCLAIFADAVEIKKNE